MLLELPNRKAHFGLLLQVFVLFNHASLELHKYTAVPGELPSKFTMSEKPNIGSWLCDANVKMYKFKKNMHYGKIVLRS